MDGSRPGALRPARYRFYPALFRSGLVDRVIDASSGYSDADRRMLLDRGIGITNLVARATARADELGPAELVAGGTALRAGDARRLREPALHRS